MRYFIRCLHYLRRHWKLAIISLIIIVLSSMASLLAPWPLKIIVDSVLGNHPLPPLLNNLITSIAQNRLALLILLVVAGFSITLIQHALSVLESYVNTRMDQWIALDFRSDLFRHAERLPMSFYEEGRAGKMIYALNFQAHAAAQLVMSVPPLMQSVITLVGMLLITYHIEPRLALLSLTVIPFLYYSVSYYVKYIQKRLLEVKEMEGETLSIIHEAISMLRVIIAFCLEEHEFRKFRRQGEEALDARVKLTVRQTLFSLSVNTITALGTSIVLGYGAYLALQGRLTTGDLLVIIAYVGSIYKPLETISSTVGSLQDQLVSLQIAFSLLDRDPEIKDAPDAVEIAQAKGHIVYRDVQFHYKSRKDTLRDISFEAKPGEVIALVGPTGAGKTTLISLMMRFYEPQQGQILLDGVDTRKIMLRSLRQQIGLVLQEPLLFSGSLIENIRHGRLDASMEEIIEAARAANAHDFIMRLPKQYETVLGERGAQLSVGERQRISIARAFLKNAPILILDEPTSAIDSRTESIILDALDRLMEGRTTFIIAHRLSTVRHADTILVISNGMLVEQGTHDKLLERGGLYKELYEFQSRQRVRKINSIPDVPLIAAPVGSAHASADEPTPLETVTVGVEPISPFALHENGSDTAPLKEGDPELVPLSPIAFSPPAIWSVPNPVPAGTGPGRTVVHWDTGDGSPGEVYIQTGDQPEKLLAQGSRGSAEVSWINDPSLKYEFRLYRKGEQRDLIASVEVVRDAPEEEPLSDPELPEEEPLLETPSSGAELNPKTEAVMGMRPLGKEKIVVLGMMARHPVAGVIWQTLHYLIGFERLGYDVYYVEAHGGHPSMFSRSKGEDASARAASFIAEVMKRFGLGDRWVFQALHSDGRCYGMSESQLRDLYRSAHLIINLHGATQPLPEHYETGRLVYLETDPVALQIELYEERKETIQFLEPHCAFFTFGENYGRNGCRLPVSEQFRFHPTRQPVVLDFWDRDGSGDARAFTTIGNWQQSWREIKYQGEIYHWSKHFEFMKFLDLPTLTSQEFELALSRIDEADKKMLEGKGWRIRSALDLSMDIEIYRRYIFDSRGEFTVAKDQNIRMQTGWFSDRSATYLAAGRPVITQETGFSQIFPTGHGLFAFSTVEEVMQAVESINSNYAHHCRAAYALAHDYFHSDLVLRRLLEDIGA